MSNDTPRMPHLGKYLRDRFVDLDREKVAHVETGLRAISEEDREKFAGLLSSVGEMLSPMFPGHSQPRSTPARFTPQAGARYQQKQKAQQAQQAQAGVDRWKQLGKTKGPITAGSASSMLRGAGRSLSGAGRPSGTAAAAAPKAPKPKTTP